MLQQVACVTLAVVQVSRNWETMVLGLSRTILAILLAASCEPGSETGDQAQLDESVIADDISQPDASMAVATAEADGRLDEYLDDNPYTIEAVTEASMDNGLLVIFAFDEPLADDSDYPLDVCLVDTSGQPITGVVWLIQDDRVQAVSPRWGTDLTCVS